MSGDRTATIETAIRIIRRWQKDDVLHTESDGRVVLDREALDDGASILKRA